MVWRDFWPWVLVAEEILLLSLWIEHHFEWSVHHGRTSINETWLALPLSVLAIRSKLLSWGYVKYLLDLYSVWNCSRIFRVIFRARIASRASNIKKTIEWLFWFALDKWSAKNIWYKSGCYKPSWYKGGGNEAVIFVPATSNSQLQKKYQTEIKQQGFKINDRINLVSK